MNKKLPLIGFVTTNSSKFSGYQSSLEALSIQIEQLSYELYEPQTVDINKIISSKLSQAKIKFPNKNIIVDDRSLFIPALNNFPGPILKLAMNTLGADGFLKLMEDKSDRTMIFTTAMGFFDSKNKRDYYFFHNEYGKMLTEKRGANLRGWTEILYIYAHESYPNKSLAEYTDNEWKDHHDEVNITKDLQKKISEVIKLNLK